MSKFTSESVKSTAGTVAAALAIPVLIGGSLTGMIAGATAGGDEQNQSQPAASAHLNSAHTEDAPAQEKQDKQPEPAENGKAEPAPAENHAVEAAPVAEQAPPPPPPALPEIPGYGPHETQNAATIVAVGKQLNVSERGQVVAIATAMQESGLRNLDWGDRDSLGLFQQRPSMGWGTPEEVTDPAYSATKFYQGLMQVPGWENMALTDAAQVVQKSGFPYAYAKHEPTARIIVDAVKGLS
ncbi:hypothetical protein BAY61_25115 [Prauserella marina]|uniref:Uncharacterized protein n=1 Tax=Prauserella marina TaxID=530584 RepID=A0A222VUY0_9PSEU|nr:hypothetical protein BAY61_25115 [Prauserella marina]PWV75682.1 hypothetical protein DES30_106300 [Prauserella marina]SDD28874.1 hypothetical protein SAMN05421630_107141 [Prauserella marina]